MPTIPTTGGSYTGLFFVLFFFWPVIAMDPTLLSAALSYCVWLSLFVVCGLRCSIPPTTGFPGLSYWDGLSYIGARYRTGCVPITAAVAMPVYLLAHAQCSVAALTTIGRGPRDARVAFIRSCRAFGGPSELLDAASVALETAPGHITVSPRDIVGPFTRFSILSKEKPVGLLAIGLVASVLGVWAAAYVRSDEGLLFWGATGLACFTFLIVEWPPSL